MSDLVGTYAQVAQRLEMSENHVRALVAAGVFRHCRLGRRRVIPWKSLEEDLARLALKAHKGLCPFCSRPVELEEATG